MSVVIMKSAWRTRIHFVLSHKKNDYNSPFYFSNLYMTLSPFNPLFFYTSLLFNFLFLLSLFSSFVFLCFIYLSFNASSFNLFTPLLYASLYQCLPSPYVSDLLCLSPLFASFLFMPPFLFLPPFHPFLILQLFHFHDSIFYGYFLFMSILFNSSHLSMDPFYL